MLTTFFNRAGEQISRSMTIARVARELNGYTDRELNDIGLTRSDIPRVAREAAQKQGR